MSYHGMLLIFVSFRGKTVDGDSWRR